MQILKEKYSEEYFKSNEENIFENENLFKDDFNEMNIADLLKSYAGREVMRKTFDTNRYKVIDSVESVRLTREKGEQLIVKKELKIKNLTDQYSFIYDFNNHAFDNSSSLLTFAKKKVVGYLYEVISSKSKNGDGSVWDLEIVNERVDGIADVNLFIVSKLKV